MVAAAVVGAVAVAAEVAAAGATSRTGAIQVSFIQKLNGVLLQCLLFYIKNCSPRTRLISIIFNNSAVMYSNRLLL